MLCRFRRSLPFALSIGSTNSCSCARAPSLSAVLASASVITPSASWARQRKGGKVLQGHYEQLRCSLLWPAKAAPVATRGHRPSHLQPASPPPPGRKPALSTGEPPSPPPLLSGISSLQHHQYRRPPPSLSDVLAFASVITPSTSWPMQTKDGQSYMVNVNSCAAANCGQQRGANTTRRGPPALPMTSQQLSHGPPLPPPSAPHPSSGERPHSLPPC